MAFNLIYYWFIFWSSFYGTTYNSCYWIDLFFKNYNKITVKQFIVANVISVAILLFIFKLLLPSTLKLFGYLEVFFVNSVGLPFNSGTIVAA